MSIEEYFRYGLSRSERKNLQLAELKIGISRLLRRLGNESFFIKTMIDNVAAGLIVYNLAEETNIDVVVVLDWLGIHIMSRELMIKRLSKFLENFRKAELNYYTLQYLGVLIKDKKHYQKLLNYIADNLEKNLPNYFHIQVIGRRKIIIERRDS